MRKGFCQGVDVKCGDSKKLKGMRDAKGLMRNLCDLGHGV